MKGFKCIKYLILCITCLLSLNLFSNAKALDFRENGQRDLSNCIITIGGYQYNGIAGDGCAFLSNTSISYRTGWANSITMNLSQALPGKSLIILSGRYTIPGDDHGFVGFQGNSQLSVVSSSFSVIQTADYYETTFQYVFYTPYPLSSIGFNSGRILWFENNNTRIDINKIDYVTLTDEPTSQQMQQIISVLNTYNQNLSNISSDTSNIWQYLQDQQDQDEEDRENIETQQEETSEQASDTSSDVQGATTNIIGVISGFSDALNNIQTGNCTLPTISAYGFSLGNINLCTYSPPSWVQGAVSIVVSFITLKLAIAVFYRIMGALDGVLGGKK